MADYAALHGLGTAEEQGARYEIGTYYEPTQPYHQGLAGGIDNQTVIGSGLDVTKLLSFRPPERQDHPAGHFACEGFFRSIANEDWRDEFSGVCWNYTMRRQAQKLLPYLYVGPVTAARNQEFLRNEGITLLVGIRFNDPSFAMVVNATRTAQALGIEAEHIDLGNVNELTALMPQIIRGINNHVCRCPNHPENHKKNLKKALLFCETGNEKSIAVAIGYIMAMLGLDLSTAVHNVQARRLCANFEYPQVEVLQAFDMILQAQRDVVRSQFLSVPNGLQPDRGGTPIPRKRSFQETGDVERNDLASMIGMDLDFQPEDTDEFEGRLQPPPFCER